MCELDSLLNDSNSAGYAGIAVPPGVEFFLPRLLHLDRECHTALPSVLETSKVEIQSSAEELERIDGVRNLTLMILVLPFVEVVQSQTCRWCPEGVIPQGTPQMRAPA